jgi:hypothetical protein
LAIELDLHDRMERQRSERCSKGRYAVFGVFWDERSTDGVLRLIVDPFSSSGESDLSRIEVERY